MLSTPRTDRARPYVRTVSLVVLATAMLTPAACAHPATTAAPPAATGSPSSRAPAGPPATSASASPSRPAPTTAAPQPAHRASAADQLAAYFAGAQRADRQIRDVATMVNNRARGKDVRVDAATHAALRAIDLDALARTIPAGLPPRLQQAVLLVHSELVARRYAFVPIEETAAGTSIPLAGVLGDCLRGGASPAARFARDLAAARTLAASLPRIAVPAPSHRAGAELALRVQFIALRNRGGLGCGGRVLTTLPPVVWKSGTEGSNGHYDGFIWSTSFTANYVAGRGWTVTIHAN